MRHKTLFDRNHLYFITTSTIKKRNIFQNSDYCDIIICSLNYIRKEKWVKLYSYVIMPNHLHIIIKFLDSYDQSKVMRDFKKFTSKKIIQMAEILKDVKILEFFRKYADSKRQKNKVWEDEFQDRNIYSARFLFQKMRYIHNNPLQEKWRLAEKPEDYRYSSARNYILNDNSVLKIDHFEELF